MTTRHWTSADWTANLALATLLVGVLMLHLLLGLLVGLVAFTLHQRLLAASVRLAPRRPNAMALLLFWLVLIGAVVGIAASVQAFELGSPVEVLHRLGELFSHSLDRLRAEMPPWLPVHLPESIEVARAQAVAWLSGHGEKLRGWGTETLRATVHAVIGLVIGLLASMRAGLMADPPKPADEPVPEFLRAWREALRRLAAAFGGVMGAQLRISAVNTVLSAVYLLVLAPLLGQPVPLAKALVGLTFVAGLIPVVGNLLSNAAILLASLVVSPTLAVLSLIYLVAIHKLEYFLNARLVGGRIEARTYELLAALLLFEALFGLRGVVAAPIYYAWTTAGLRQARWL
jgi:predicted PurR-regulated permease PerM